jgi:hypothetical protein
MTSESGFESGWTMQFSLKPVLCSSAGLVELVLFGVLARLDWQEIKNCFRTSAIRYRRKWNVHKFGFGSRQD